MNQLKYFTLFIFILFIISCNNGNNDAITYNGRVEADIISLSAQVGGTLDVVDI